MWDLQTLHDMNDERSLREQAREEEHKREVQEAYDRGYNAGRYDATMDEAYARGDIDNNDFDH